ncbi:MAG: cytochrome d ubiquinol oxidase subunit II [Ignavibacteria bacterium]|nr:cytochrome d ubiquinol oxidase subunit II [Ignavibacteria bacterium]
METLWFIIVAFMITMYVVLDGFDLGVGVLYLLLGTSDSDRQTMLKTIAPFWDGNEVWLLAAGGTLYFAFPMLYASSFSGFYLPLMIVLWLLMLRGAGIELRHQLHHPMWKSFWDVVFSLSSVLLVVFFGAALGNVIRGVPLHQDGYFFEPLWTTFTVVPEAGILDWFTVLIGLVALFTLTAHGAHYISMKTTGDIQIRARSYAAMSWWGVLLTSILALVATSSIRPEIWNNYAEHPWGYIFPLGGILGLAGMYIFPSRGKDTSSFLSSTLFIVSMLSATAFGLYPHLLPSSTDPQYSLTVYNAAAQHYGLSVGLLWWIVGMLLAGGYFTYLYRSFRGKVSSGAEGEMY